jgi:3-oxoadipate enol-lactonase
MPLEIDTFNDAANAGKAIVFLHAFPLSNQMWHGTIATLSKKISVPVFAPNFYGFGEPKHHATGLAHWRMTNVADDLFAFLNSKRITKVTLVGLSMGGYAAFAFYKRYASHVTGLVLCNTRAEADADAARKGRYEFIEAISKNGIEEANRRMLEKFFSPATLLTKPEVVADIRRLISSARESAVQDALEALAEREDSSPLLAQIAVPTLVVCGKDDVLTPPALSESMQRQIKNARLVLLDQAGHLSNIEQPEAFNLALLNFLNANRLA